MTVSVRLLGEFEVHSSCGTSSSVSARKARALLAYLCVRAGRPQQRQHIATLLWGDVSSDEYARKSLRQALTVLRRELPDGLFEATRDELWIEPSKAQIDVKRFEALARQSEREALEQAVALYRGELLEGFRSRSDAFDDWLSSERLRLRERVVDALGRLLSFQREANDGSAAASTAIRMVSLDPLREEAHQALMLSYAEVGRLGDAIEQYENCRVVLERELGRSPSSETNDLLKRLRSGHVSTAALAPTTATESASVTQLRVVAVLAISASDSNPDLETEEGVIATAINEHGGVLLRRTATSAVAVFGAHRSHGSEVVRAASAALRIGKESPGLYGCGICYAQAMVMRNGPSISVVGEAISQAGNFAAKAEAGGVLVSESVRQALREGALARGLSLVVSSAAAERVRAWRLRDRADESGDQVVESSSQRTTPFVGRSREIAILQAVLSTCQDCGEGQLIMIRGEAGIGKTRLVERCASLAERMGYRTYRATALDFGPQNERDVIAQLTRALLHRRASADGLADGSSATQQPKSTRDHDLLLQLAGLDKADAKEALGRGMREARAARKLQLWCELWQRESLEQATLVIIDDLHWADQEALDPITTLLDQMQRSPLVLLVSTRPDGSAENPRWLGALRGRAVTSMDLGPLSLSEGRSLAQELSITDPGLIEAALERSGGHPLFLEQLLWTHRPAELTESIHAALQARLDQLALAETTALGAASVLGLQFDSTTLSEVIDSDPPLEGLLRSGLLRNPEGRFMFSHALIRDAVYETLPPAERRRLHARAARAVKQIDLSLVAEHLERAEDPNAADAYLEAAREADSRERVSSALELAERGLELTSDPGLGFTLTQLRSRLLRRLGRGEAAERAARDALAIATTSTQRARAWVSLAESLRGTSRDDEALQSLQAAEQSAATDDHATRSHVHYLTGSVLFPTGQAQASLEAHQLALSHAKLANCTRAEARALSGLGDAHYVQGDLRRATQHFEACVTVCDRVGLNRLARVNRVMLNLIRVFMLDRPREATHAMLDFAELAHHELDLSGDAVGRSAALLGVVLCENAELREKVARQVVDASRRSGRQRLGFAAAAYVIEAQVAQGRAVNAERELDAIYERCSTADIPFVALNTLGPMLACSQPGPRRTRLFEEADRILEGGRSVSHSLYAFSRFALDACLQAREFERLERYAHILEDYTQPHGVAWGGYFCEWARCLSRWHRGDRQTVLRDSLAHLGEVARTNHMLREAMRVAEALR